MIPQNSSLSSGAELSENNSAATSISTSDPGRDVRRKIGRWFVGETLGKGGYSWVKKGYDRKTGQPVALKFIDRNRNGEGLWSESQSRQVKTEVEALKQMKNPTIMRLHAYNFNAKYPDLNGGTRNVVLLVLEYMPGGELFDILYYTAHLEEIVARTYFRQLIDGIDACHKAGIVHRDIKPQNLLLNEFYQLKITDFGLSKLMDGGAENARMETFHVGTRGYQAPEVLMRTPYNELCDVFSAAVVLFILLTGYPPFEHAKPSDKWYAPMTKGNARRFWRNHRGCGVPSPAKDLITKMLAYDPSNRISIDEIRQHPWYRGEVLPMQKLAQALRLRHRMMEVKRRNDPKKQKVLIGSNDIRVPAAVRDLPGFQNSENPQAPVMFDTTHIDLNSVYTTKSGHEVLAILKFVCENQFNGECEVDWVNFIAEMDVATSDAKVVKVGIRVFYHDSLQANMVCFRRIQGDFFTFRKVLKLLKESAGEVLTGLPDDKLHVDDSDQNLLNEVFGNLQEELHA